MSDITESVFPGHAFNLISKANDFADQSTGLVLNNLDFPNKYDEIKA